LHPGVSISTHEFETKRLAVGLKLRHLALKQELRVQPARHEMAAIGGWLKP
jgi:hypothetical protein